MGRRSLAEKGLFVVWDGEGIEDDNDMHLFRMLACGWYDAQGEWHYHAIFAKKPHERLASKDILYFVHKILNQLPEQAIHVGFSMGYDVTHILRDLSWSLAKQALHTSRKMVARWEGHRIKYRPRKELQIWFPEHKQVPRCERWRHYWHLWDVFGFFQRSFVLAVEEWLGKDYPDLPLIKRGKLRRGETIDEETFRYTEAELKALHAIMVKLNQALLAQGLKLSRWDGPGAAAAKAFKKYMPKDWFKRARQQQEEELELYKAMTSAYYGGRIELIQYGTYEGELYQYDLNSAYPHAMSQLPDFANGRWEKANPVLSHSPWNLYKIRFDFSDETICPFPLRLKQSYVRFPPRGEGWYWGPEVLAAYAGGRGKIEILERWEWQGSTDRPFRWVEELYQERLRLIAEGEKGQQLAIKLTLNSLYGKSAQQLGYVPLEEELPYYEDEEEAGTFVVQNERAIIPPFYNIAVAGLITSITRARIYEGVCDNQDAVVNIATDGVLTIKPLDLYTPKEKRLGAWEFKHISGKLVIVQAGVQFLRSADGVWAEKSRGFTPAAPAGTPFDEAQRAIQERVDAVLQAWHDGRKSLTWSVRRMISLRGASVGKRPTSIWWKRGNFEQNVPRELELFPPGSATKRRRVNNDDPSQQLCMTRPYEDIFYEYPVSYSYKALPLNEGWRAEFERHYDMLDALEHA